MVIPADLLNQLREADQELWKRYAETDLSREEERIDETWRTAEANEAWLQYCLQEAIRARGWHISQSVMCWCRERPYYAAIRKSEYDHWVGETGNTEADALLKAYLAVICTRGAGED